MGGSMRAVTVVNQKLPKADAPELDRLIAYVEGPVLAARDLAVAAYDLIVGRARRQYRYDVVVKAPKEILRRLLTASDVTYEKANLRVVTEPLAGQDGVEVERAFVAGRPCGGVAFRRTEVGPDTFLLRYLPEFSEHAPQLGADDTSETSLQALADGSTRMRWARTLTHRRAGTRVSVPTALRQVARRLKVQAEQEAGHTPTPARSQLGGLIWFLAAVASFWLLFGWRDAGIVTAAIIVHELGHAAAMLITGRGVRFIALVPFLGGMAYPKSHYENEWQRAFVALMGPGLSLVPTLGLFWLAYSMDSALAGRAAFIFAALNGINLLPLVPLDGGIIADALLRSVHARLGQAIAWLGVTAGLGLAVYGRSVAGAFVFLCGAVQLVFQSSFDVTARVKRLGGLQAPALIAAVALTIFAYGTVVVRSDPSARVPSGRAGPQAPTHQMDWPDRGATRQ
jgi:Zn-dependent protease